MIAFSIRCQRLKLIMIQKRISDSDVQMTIVEYAIFLFQHRLSLNIKTWENRRGKSLFQADCILSLPNN